MVHFSFFLFHNAAMRFANKKNSAVAESNYDIKNKDIVWKYRLNAIQTLSQVSYAPMCSFEFFCRFRLTISSNVGYYTVGILFCQALFSKNLKIHYIASTANFFEHRTIGALRRWHQRAIRSTTQLSLQPLSTDPPNSVLTQICQKIHFSKFYEKSKSLFSEKPLNRKTNSCKSIFTVL